MIITCPNCNKQFKIDNSLIPNEGRDLQCGSCSNTWFYKVDDDKDQILELREEILSNETDTKEIKIPNNSEEIKKNKNKVNKEKKQKIEEKTKPITASKKIENKGSKFFPYLVVFVISFVALIILLDTLKTPLIGVFPELKIILFNLFETLQDIKLFIIDLI